VQTNKFKAVKEGFEKPEILVVFNAGVKLKPQHPSTDGFEDFNYATRQKTGKRSVLQCLLKVWLI